MSEVTFAKSFLATLDKRAIKLPGDHVSDPKKHPNTSPYVLPKQTHPFPRRGPVAAQQAAPKSITVSMKPMRSGDAVPLPEITLDTSIHDLKTQYASKAGLLPDKIKILLNKKPAADLKTLQDLGVEGDVELSVMIMAGASAAPSAAPSPQLEKSEAAASAPPAADAMDIDSQAPAPESEKAQAEVEEQQTSESDSVAEMLKTDEFWEDLKGFLSQRLRHQAEGERLAKLFQDAASRR